MSFAVSAQDPICPAEWKPGYEFLYPPFCRPAGYQSRWLLPESKTSLRDADGKEYLTESVDISELKTKTKYLASIAGFFLYGVMDQLPRDATNWPEGGSDFDRWEKSVHGLPHWDHDDWKWNYIAHPLAGSAYYNVCREGEFTRAQCFFYSFLVSAFIWEYGFEATKERPSIQDIIITPAAGALIGEMAYQLAEEIRENGGKVLGSKALGDTFLVLLNPIGNLVHSVRAFVEPLNKDINAKLYFRYGPSRQRHDVNFPPMSDYYRSLYEADEKLMITLKIPFRVDWRGRIRLGE